MNPQTAPVDEEILGLTFVFSADSGRLNAIVDSARKLLQLNGCSLCAITHGLAGEKGEWKDCKDELGIPVDYVHRDEITPELGALVGNQLPCVVAHTASREIVILDSDVLERCKGSVADFKGRLKTYASMNGLRLATPLAA